MRHPGRLTATLALLLAAATGDASESLVAGKKLLLKTPAASTGNRVVHLGTGAMIAVGAEGSAGDPRCVGAGGGGASSLRIATSGGDDVTIPLPCYGWSLNGAKNAYRYKDPGGGPCKLVMVKDGALVKAVCKGPQVAVDLGPGVAPVAVVTTLNTDRFCASYGGTVVHDGSDGATLLHKDAPVAASCATTTSTTPVSGTTSTTLACCILYAGQCTWTSNDFDCIAAGGASTGEPGSVCDGVTGGCLQTASPGYCCDYPTTCTSGPTGDPMDCSLGSGTVYPSALCQQDGACHP
jgi:hypothetical protein